MDALVTDAQLRSVVAGIRGLGRAGLRVIALAPRRKAAGLWSRYATERSIVPNSIGEPRGFAEAVMDLARRRGPLVVYPGREESIDALVERWGELPDQAILPYAGPEALRAVREKPGLARLAETVGLSAPATLAVVRAAELAASSPPPPYVVKPADPVGRLGSAYLIETQEQLAAVLERRGVPGDEPVLVQEHAQGPLHSIELVLDREGNPVARFQQVSRETYPLAAGSISLATSVAPDEELVEQVAAMLANAGYWGLAQVDIVRTEAGPKVVDVNPRFYSCLALAGACGVNLPAVWHEVALDRSPPPPGPYRTGVTFRWLEGDFAAAARGAPRRLLRRTPRPRVGAMWARDDPAPGMILASGAVALRIERGLGRRGRG